MEKFNELKDLVNAAAMTIDKQSDGAADVSSLKLDHCQQQTVGHVMPTSDCKIIVTERECGSLTPINYRMMKSDIIMSV